MAKKNKPKKKMKKPKKSVKKPKKQVKAKKIRSIKKAQEQLEKAAKAETEKELKQKCKDLASIIEEMSTATEEIPVTKVEDILQPKLKEVAQVFDEQLKGLKETLETLEKKMEKPTKLKGQVSGAASRIEEKIEPRIASIEEQMKALDKIAEIEKKFNELTGETKDGKRVPKLSILENRVIKAMQEDLMEVKEAVQNLYHSLNMMRDKTQKKIQKIQETLTPETLQKLHELIAFLDKAVPSKVKEEVGDKFNTVFDRLRELDKNVSGLEKRINKILKEVSENEQKLKVIKDIKASLAELYVEKDNLYKIAENIRTESAQSDDVVELKFQSNIDQVIKKFDEFDVVINNYLKDVQKKLNKTISEFSKTQVLALEKRYLKKLSPIKEDIKDLQIDLSKLSFRSKPIDYYSTGYHKFVEDMNSISSNKDIFKTLDALDKIFKLNDFAASYNLYTVLQAIIDSQFLDPLFTQNFGAFLINNINYSSERKNELIYLQYSFYAIKAMELIADFFSLGSITGVYFSDLGFDKSALTTYIVRNIVESPTELYLKSTILILSS